MQMRQNQLRHQNAKLRVVEMYPVDCHVIEGFVDCRNYEVARVAVKVDAAFFGRAGCP